MRFPRIYGLLPLSLIAINLLISCSSGSGSSSNSSDIPSFDNVFAQAGLGGAGGLGQTDAWGDFNNDAWQDLILLSALGSSNNVSLSRNNANGTFTNVTNGSGLLDQKSRSVAWADFNNDNLLDLVVGTITALAPPILYQNLGNGIFVDVSLGAGITKEGGVVGHTIWSDYDGDGGVDLFQANMTDSVRSFLYHNNKDGTFDEVSDISGLGQFVTNSAVWFDFNNDGFPDLFLENTGLNTLYLNNGDGTFADVTDNAGVAGDPDWNSEAACVGDFNGDGFLDLYVVNIFSNTPVRNALYRNNGNGTFTDVTEATDTGDVGDGRTCAWVDFDGDGRIDIFTTNHVNPSRLFRNLGNGKFADVASQVGLATPIDVFGAAWGDYNNDGFMDVFLNGHIGVGLMENSGTQNNFIIINLAGDGVTTNISAIGARVEVTTSKGTQIREVSGGRGCCEQDMLPVHFGLGNEGVADILVRWTGGDECSFEGVNVEGGRLFQISENGCNISEF
jgi:hypothetical protein